MTVSEQFIPTDDEQESGGGGLFGLKFTPPIIGIIIAVLGIGASVGLFIYVLQPEWAKQEELKTKISTKEQEIATFQNSIARKQEAIANREQAKQQKAEVSTLFGDAKTMDTLLFDINKIVKQGKAKLNEFKPTNQETISMTLFPSSINKNLPSASPLENAFQGLPFSMELEGSFAQTQSILRNIERLEPLLTVSKLTSEIDQQTLNVEVDSQGKVIRLIDPTIKTTFNLLAIVPKSTEELAALKKAAEEKKKAEEKAKKP